jgi:hypothetical protein
MKRLMAEQYLKRSGEYERRLTIKIGAGLDPAKARAAIAAERLQEAEERRLKKKKIRDQK